MSKVFDCLKYGTIVPNICMALAKETVIKVLVAPLDWGLGHATRCIPIIRELLKLGCEVHLAGSGRSLILLKAEFSDLQWHPLSDYEVRYDRKSMGLAMLEQASKILNAIKAEGRETAALQESEKFDLIISDNRYGVHHAGTYCVFVGHQLNIKVNGIWSLAKPFIDSQNKSRIVHFDELWIPDWESPNNISGSLSNTKNLGSVKKKYLGALSRFAPKRKKKAHYKTLSVLSGPEPQRTLFENALLKQLSEIDGEHLLVRGVSESAGNRTLGNVKILDHLKADELQQAFENCEIAISRSGYSSLMDYFALSQKAILVATPGQTEQMYLAEQMAKRNGFVSQEQGALNITEGMAALEKVVFPEGLNNSDLLNTALRETVETLQVKKLIKP